MSIAKKFDLLICSFPGGYSYTNKAVIEHGDYKSIAFIDRFGCIRFDVPVSYIPDNALLRIEHDADAMRANFRKEWDSKTELEKFCKLGDWCGLRAWLDMDRSWTLSEKVDYLEYAVFGWVPHSEKIAETIAARNIIPMMQYTKFYER